MIFVRFDSRDWTVSGSRFVALSFGRSPGAACGQKFLGELKPV